MSLNDVKPLLAALKSRLETELAWAGFPDEEGGAGLAVPVFKDLNHNSAELYVRIDNGSMLSGSSHYGASDRHTFTVRSVYVADRGSDEVRDGGDVTSELAAKVRNALKGWAPLQNAGAIKFLGGFPAEEETPDTSSYVCRFEVHINGD